MKNLINLFKFTKFQWLIFFFAVFVTPDIRKYIYIFFNNILSDTLNEKVLNVFVTFFSLIIISIIVKIIKRFFLLFKIRKNYSNNRYRLLNYNLLYLEDIERWAKLNGLSHKVPDNLWAERLKARNKCNINNIKENITLDIIIKTNNSYKNLIKIDNEILELLKKK